MTSRRELDQHSIIRLISFIFFSSEWAPTPDNNQCQTIQVQRERGEEGLLFLDTVQKAVYSSQAPWKGREGKKFKGEKETMCVGWCVYYYYYGPVFLSFRTAEKEP